MADSYVRVTASLDDLDGVPLRVGVDYDTVTLGYSTMSAPAWRLTRAQCEEFAQAFVAACWEAADNARLMAEEAAT